MFLSLFQSAPPVKGATSIATSGIPSVIVSIRAPREGGDQGESGNAHAVFGFNPRPP